MPSNTAGGLPYPLSTEPVRDGAQAIKNLADAIELRGGGLLVQYFSGGVSPLSASGDYNWTFPKAFKAGTVPAVVVTQLAAFGAAATDHMICSVVKEYTTATLASLRFRRGTDGSNPGAGGGVYISVVAVGVAP